MQKKAQNKNTKTSKNKKQKQKTNKQTNKERKKRTKKSLGFVKSEVWNRRSLVVPLMNLAITFHKFYTLKCFPSCNFAQCLMVRYAQVLFVKITLYSVYVYRRGTLCYGGLSMFLHRHNIAYSCNMN